MIGSLLMLSEAASANAGLANMSLMGKGLVTTVLGLLGVFLVLTVFFITIKLMQRIKPKEEKKD